MSCSTTSTPCRYCATLLHCTCLSYHQLDLLQDYGNGPVGAVRVGRYKLILGDPGRPDGWIPPPAVLNLGSQADTAASGGLFNEQPCTVARSALLFDLATDPTERTDLAQRRPDLVERLTVRLDQYRATALLPDVTGITQAGNPAHFSNTWSPGWCSARP